MSDDRRRPSDRRRRAAVRTALVLGGVVSLIYIGFIMSGVIGST